MSIQPITSRKVFMDPGMQRVVLVERTLEGTAPRITVLDYVGDDATVIGFAYSSVDDTRPDGTRVSKEMQKELGIKIETTTSTAADPSEIKPHIVKPKGKRGGKAKYNYDKEALLADLDAGMKAKEVAEKYDMPTSTVYQIKSDAKKAGALSDDGQTLSAKQKQIVKERIAQGVSTGDIADEIDADIAAVNDCVAALRSKPPIERWHPEPKPKKKSLEQEVRKLLEKGFSVTEIVIATGLEQREVEEHIAYIQHNMLG